LWINGDLATEIREIIHRKKELVWIGCGYVRRKMLVERCEIPPLQGRQMET
jgi:hypothetical protein